MIPDVQELDRDIGRAMDGGGLTFADLMVAWVTRIPADERHAFIRYVSERVHDVLLAWSPPDGVAWSRNTF